MAFTLKNGDRFRLTKSEDGAIIMELARKAKAPPDGDGTWKNGPRTRVSIEARTLHKEGWTVLKVLRWYRYILQDALTFGVAGRVLEVAQPTRLVPLGVPTTVLKTYNPKRPTNEPVGPAPVKPVQPGTTAGLF